MKKKIQIDENASKELHLFSSEVQAKFVALFSILEQDEFLKDPFAKRLTSDLFENRVKHEGQWRALYAYTTGDIVLILSAFNKKTQKTPLKEIKKS